MKNKIQNPNIDIVIGQISSLNLIVGSLIVIFLLTCFVQICKTMVCPQTSLHKVEILNDGDVAQVHVPNDNTYDKTVKIIITEPTSQIIFRLESDSISKTSSGTNIFIKIPGLYKSTLTKNSIIECELVHIDSTILDVVLWSITDVF